MDGAQPTEERYLDGPPSYQVTRGADLLYEVDMTKVFRTCYLWQGQAATASTYDCRLPLRCTYGDGREEAMWVAINCCGNKKNRCLLVRETGQPFVLNSAALLKSIGGAALTEAERSRASKGLKQRQQDATSGNNTLGGRGKSGKRTAPPATGSRKTRREDAPPAPPRPSTIAAAVAEALASAAGETDPAGLATSLVDTLPDRMASPLATGLADHSAPIAKALAAALRPSVGKDLVAAVKGVLQQEARRDRDRLQQRVTQLEEQLTDTRGQVRHLQEENADVRRTRDAAQAAADTERSASVRDREALHAAQLELQSVRQELAHQAQTTNIWRDMVEREAGARAGIARSGSQSGPTQLTATGAFQSSQSSQSSPAPSTPQRQSQPEQARRSPRSERK